jgi:hypothetical protein
MDSDPLTLGRSGSVSAPELLAGFIIVAGFYHARPKSS